jgi:hypothetical protein
MSTTCPVCGLGETDFPTRFDYTPVSHLACVENIYTANLSLRVRVQQAEAEAERLTLWGECNEALAVEEGVKRQQAEARISGYQDELVDKQNALLDAEREAAFWKWMWYRPVGEYPDNDDATWLAHMRERWERGARP